MYRSDHSQKVPKADDFPVGHLRLRRLHVGTGHYGPGELDDRNGSVFACRWNDEIRTIEDIQEFLCMSAAKQKAVIRQAGQVFQLASRTFPYFHAGINRSGQG